MPVVGQDRHPGLGDDRSAIEFGGDEVDACPVFGGPRLDGAPVGMQALEGRQQFAGASYGLDAAMNERYFSTSTPGAAPV